VDYASLKMPDETRNYIPKLLAVKNIVSAPDKFGLTLQPVPNKPYFATVTTGHHIDVKLAAQLAGISMEEFSALNPAHNRPVILQDSGDMLLLPVGKVDTFRANLDSYSDPLVSWQAYRSKKGERLDKLAPRFGLSVAKLKSVNGLPTRAKVSNGQALLVPLNGESADGEFEAFNTHLTINPSSAGSTSTHIVRKGETLSSISRRYHVSMTKLSNWNSDVNQIKPGQTIIIGQTSKPHQLSRPGKSRTRATLAAKNRTHTARAAKTRTHTALAAKTRPNLARSGKNRTHTARAGKTHKRIARKAQNSLHVADNR
jgi:membrane-bound lytic murein transglycosylase D